MVRVFVHSAEECVICGDDFSEVTVVKTAIANLGIAGFINKCLSDKGDMFSFDSDLAGTITVNFNYE